MYFNLYSPDNSQSFIDLCAQGVPIGGGGDLHIRNTNLKDFPNFKMFDAFDPTIELRSGQLGRSSPTDNHYIIDYSLSNEVPQPTQFFLRIYNDTEIFKESFTILQNTGLYFDSALLDYFVFSQETQFVSSLQNSEELKTEDYKTFFFLFLGLSVALLLFPFFLLNIIK